MNLGAGFGKSDKIMKQAGPNKSKQGGKISKNN